LNRNPELKAFLKGGEVENYEGVEVEWIRGRKAVMHIYEDGKEVEKVDIYELTTHAAIVKTMEEKGLRLKSTQQLLRERVLKRDLTTLKTSSLTGNYTLYMVAGLMAIIVLGIIARGKVKGRKLRIRR